MSDIVKEAVKSIGKDSTHGWILELRNIGLCCYCILRLIGVPVGKAYLESEEAVYSGLEIAAPDTEACPLCLGVLCPGNAKTIAEQYREEGFDAEKVSVGVNLPKSIYVREWSVKLFLKNNIQDIADSVDLIGTKDIIKYMISEIITALCSVEIIQDNSMVIEVEFEHEETSSDHKFLIKTDGKRSKPRFNHRNRERVVPGDSRDAVLKGLRECTDDDFISKFPVPPPKVQALAKIVDPISFKRESIFFGGRYLKLERNISQTPFIIENKRVTELSVSEVIGEPLRLLTKSSSYNLVGSGREDADVRMLGNGRPFYIECFNPRITKIQQEQISEIQANLYKAKSPVQTKHLQIIKAADTSIIKEGEENKSKLYCALVWISKQLSEEKIAEINRLGSKGIELQQKTPIRVLHRRSPLTRPKKLHSMELIPIEGHFYRLRIESEAGTYIKEFVHGDLGRTTPSLSSIADATSDILELDVENVSLVFPPHKVQK